MPEDKWRDAVLGASCPPFAPGAYYGGGGALTGPDGRSYPIVIPTLRIDGTEYHADHLLRLGQDGVTTLGGSDKGWVTLGVVQGVASRRPAAGRAERVGVFFAGTNPQLQPKRRHIQGQGANRSWEHPHGGCGDHVLPAALSSVEPGVRARGPPRRGRPMVRGSIPLRTAVAVAVSACTLALGACTSGSEGDAQAATWCGLMRDAVDAMAEAEADGREPTTDPGVAGAMQRVHTHGAPDALEADQERIASGPPFPQTREAEEYEAAVQRTASYLVDECGIDESEMPLLGG